MAQEWKPIDFKKWQAIDNDTMFQANIGGPIQNYSDTDTSWAEIENDWVTIGDTMTARHAYMKTDVLPNGVSRISIEHNDTTYTITQKPVRLIWLKTDTWNWIDIAETPSWGRPAVNNDLILWMNVFPGVDYRIQKRKGRVDHGIFFKPAFLDSAIVLYDQRADSLDIALANVMEYTLSASIDSADIELGNVNKRIFKRIGRHVFGMARSELHFPGSDTLQKHAVNHRWVKQGGKIYCIEYIKMRKIKIIHEAYPSATIWHNASPHTIDGETNLEDAYLKGSEPDKNYGSYGSFYFYPARSTVSRVKNVASELGENATITACTFNAYCIVHTSTSSASAYRVFKPWVEGDESGVDNDDGDVTWNDWASDANEWTTAGCNSADDGGSDNSGDGTGADRKATAEDVVSVTTAATWYQWDISTTLAQAWYDGTANENGVVLIGDGNTQFDATEHPLEQPYWVFTYTTNGVPAGQVITIN
jgi:hypothetical protein